MLAAISPDRICGAQRTRKGWLPVRYHSGAFQPHQVNSPPEEEKKEGGIEPFLNKSTTIRVLYGLIMNCFLIMVFPDNRGGLSDFSSHWAVFHATLRTVLVSLSQWFTVQLEKKKTKHVNSLSYQEKAVSDSRSLCDSEG